MNRTVQDLVGEFPIPAIPCGVCRFAERPVEDEFCTVCVPPGMSFFERDDSEIRRRVETQLYFSKTLRLTGGEAVP